VPGADRQQRNGAPPFLNFLFQLKFLKYAKVHVDGSLRRYFKEQDEQKFSDLREIYV